MERNHRETQAQIRCGRIDDVFLTRQGFRGQKSLDIRNAWSDRTTRRSSIFIGVAAIAAAAVGILPAGGGLNSAKLAADCSTTARSGAGTWSTPTSVTAAYGLTAASMHAVEAHNSAAAGQAASPAPAGSASPVAACVIAGDYQVPAPPSRTGASPAYNLAAVTVDATGKVTPYAFGNATSLATLLSALSAS